MTPKTTLAQVPVVLALLTGALFLLTGALGLAAGSADAANLSGGTCLRLDTEKKALTAKGAASNLEKGPRWAKTHLAGVQVADVKRLLVVNERLLFRCNRQALAAARKRRNTPAFKKWLAVKPPVPQRNPKFSALKK